MFVPMRGWGPSHISCPDSFWCAPLAFTSTALGFGEAFRSIGNGGDNYDENPHPDRQEAFWTRLRRR